MSLAHMLESLPTNLRPPVNCPCCGTTLILQDSWPACPNFDCSYRVYGRLQKFINTLDIKGAGIETLKSLAEKGMVKTPGDLYRITEEQFVQLDRKGDKHYAKFRQGLELVRNLRPAQIFASLDIEGEGTWNAICSVVGLTTVEDILAAVKRRDVDLFSKATRVSPTKAIQIIQEITDRMGEVEGLLQHIQIKKTKTTLTGKVFCITGTLSVPRPKLVEMIKENGGTVSDSVSSRVSYLVTDNPGSGSSKNKKAQQYRIPIITETQLREMLH